MFSNNVMNEQIQQTKKLFLAKLYSCVGSTAGASPKPSVAGAAFVSARKNEAREGLSGRRFLSHARFQEQEISSSLLNAFLKFASLVYVRLQHRSQTEISLRLLTYLLKSYLTTFRHKYNVSV